MNLPNIMLWTFSLLLATSSLIFAIIAAQSATKANHRLKEMMDASLIGEEAQKIFFISAKEIQEQNVKTIKELEKKRLSYWQYAAISRGTRLVVIQSRVREVLKNSEYQKTIRDYITFKNDLDGQFKKMIDLQKLKSRAIIKPKVVAALLKYHQQSNQYVHLILKQYSVISMLAKK